MREIARLIRALRTRAKLTQEGLARRMTLHGVPTTRTQVTAWEAGPPNGQSPSSYKLLTIFRVTRQERRRSQVEDEIAELEAQLAVLQEDLGRLPEEDRDL